MSEESPDPKFVPPAQAELPQGAKAFIEAQEAAYEALSELFAPYVQKHGGLARNFEHVMAKMRETGFWVNDSINMMMNPQLFKAAAPEAEDAAPGQEEP